MSKEVVIFGCDVSYTGKEISIQDKNTTVQAIVARAASGVLNPSALSNGASFSEDLSIPRGMDKFEKLEYLSSLAKQITELRNELSSSTSDASSASSPSAPSTPPHVTPSSDGDVSV